jgi:hypothetical protein
LLNKFERFVTDLLGYRRPEELSVRAVTDIDPRTKYSIRAALSEVGFSPIGSQASQPLLYREVNRYGQRVWRAA